MRRVFCAALLTRRLSGSTSCQTDAQHSEQSSTLADQFMKAQKMRGAVRPAFRTSVSLIKQNLNQEGMFYTIPKEDADKFLQKAFSRDYTSQMKTFTECAIMVRRPALEVISYLKNANYKFPALKYILYGKKGCGKTISLAHIMHYCAVEGWMLIHFPWPLDWNNRFKEISMSSHKAERVDLPLESVDWLKIFRKQNGHLIDSNELKTAFNYQWSKRESTDIGSSWNELIDHGIARPKYASDCIGALLKELRHQAKNLPFKTLVVVDGVNSFWASTKLKDERYQNVTIDRYSLVHNIKKMMAHNWTNGAVVLTVDYNVVPVAERSSQYPRFLLGKEGFELMDPFIPIAVENYNVKELTSCLDYYVDRLWIQSSKGKSDEGRREMTFLSEGNPLALYNICSAA